MELLDFYGAEFADASEVVTSEVYEHVVLSKLLLIAEKIALECLVLCFRPAPRSRACERECMKDSVLEAYECLRGSACDLNIRARKIEHVR